MARIRFQLDEHVPHAVAQALRRRGVDIVTTVEAGLLAASDIEHVLRAYVEGTIVVTHDPDFLRLHERGALLYWGRSA